MRIHGTKKLTGKLTEETCEIPKNLRYYIVDDAIACDMKISGEIVDIGYKVIVIKRLYLIGWSPPQHVPDWFNCTH